MVHLIIKMLYMTPTPYIGLSISPAIALLLFIYLILINDKKFGWLLIKSYILGGISSFLCILAMYLAKREELQFSTNLTASLVYAFVIIGFSAEFGKFIILKLFVLRNQEVKTPVHGLFFSVMTSLGFATVMGVFFFFKILNSNPPFAFNMFLLLVGPANIGFGIILGYFLAWRKFLDYGFIYNIAGLVSASFFAGLFSFCMITQDYKLLSLFAFGSSIVAMVLIFRAISFRP
jgi:protease PrsW